MSEDQPILPLAEENTRTHETPTPIVVSPAEADVAEEGEAIADLDATARQLTRRALMRIALYGGGILGGLWAFNKFAPTEAGVKGVFRRAFAFNEAVAGSAFFSPDHRAQEFPRTVAIEPRANGQYGYQETSAVLWNLTLEGGTSGGGEGQNITLADIQSLPKVEQVTELKCIEGWSAIVHWTGVRFADFMRKYPPARQTPYVALFAEPDILDTSDSYYIGLDWESAIHPQTILAYAMNGMPLTADHGAPLRLVIPHKYGIKNIKWITRVAYQEARPKDYWAERGYDWYAGL